MFKSLFIILFCLFTVGCSKSNSASKNCPKTISMASNLPLAPTPEVAIPVTGLGIDATWNWQLNGILNTGYNVDVYDVDLFETSIATITSLKMSGKKVICYFSAGSSENFRTDFSQFLDSDMGQNLDGWPGERWLDVRSQNVLNIMTDRLDLAVTKGCDGVEPDNMDAFDQNTCFDISANDQLAYNRAIANLARSRGLSVALKNDPDQVNDLVGYFDFSVTEQCYFYNECLSYQPFVSAAKPIFNAEYDLAYRINPAQANLCSYSNANNIQTIVFSLGLDDTYRHQCF